MAKGSTTFRPLPTPGVAVFPKYLSGSPTNLILKTKSLSDSFDISFADGRPFLRAEKKNMMSMSHRNHIIDVASGRNICDIRKQGWAKTDHYYAEASAKGSRLFETQTKKIGGGGIWKEERHATTMKFANVAAGGKQEELYIQGPLSKKAPSIVKHRVESVASVEVVPHMMSREYRVRLAPGLDPFVVVALVLVLDDAEQTRLGAAGAGGAAGGGGVGA